MKIHPQFKMTMALGTQCTISVRGGETAVVQVSPGGGAATHMRLAKTILSMKHHILEFIIYYNYGNLFSRENCLATSSISREHAHCVRKRDQILMGTVS